MLAVSDDLSVDFSGGFSTRAGFSPVVFSVRGFSNSPRGFTPASGTLLTIAAGSEGFASFLTSAFFGSAVDAARPAGALADGLATM